MTADNPQWLTYREAARRVHRTTRTIKRWRRNGLPMTWQTIDGQQCRVVQETTLLAWWRQRMLNDPIHQARLRTQFTLKSHSRPHESHFA